MNHNEHDTETPTLSFAGASALLLLIAAFCAYPCGAYLPATIFAGLAFLSLSLAAPESNRRPIPVRVRRPDERRLPADPRR
jgi:hypothetical protein